MSFKSWNSIFDEYYPQFLKLGLEISDRDEFGLTLKNNLCEMRFGTERYNDDFIIWYLKYPFSKYQPEKSFFLEDVLKHARLAGSPLPEVFIVSSENPQKQKAYFDSLLLLLRTRPDLMGKDYPFLNETRLS